MIISMTVEIPDNVLTQAGISQAELLLKIAIVLFREEILSLGQASRLARLHQIEFQRQLSLHNIPIHYREEDLERDLNTLGLSK